MMKMKKTNKVKVMLAPLSVITKLNCCLSSMILSSIAYLKNSKYLMMICSLKMLILTSMGSVTSLLGLSKHKLSSF